MIDNLTFEQYANILTIAILVLGSAHLMASVFSLLFWIYKLKKKIVKLTDTSMIDPLTQLYNRRGIDLYWPRIIDRAKRDRQHVLLIVCDVNNFKRINDTLGHNAGDQVLKSIAIKLRRYTRPGDLVARFGGDEFIIVITIPQKASMIDITRRIYARSQTTVTSLSIGTLMVNMRREPNFNSAFHQADKLCLEAKKHKETGQPTWLTGYE